MARWEGLEPQPSDDSYIYRDSHGLQFQVLTCRDVAQQCAVAVGIGVTVRPNQASTPQVALGAGMAGSGRQATHSVPQHPEGSGGRRHLRGMLAAVTGSAPAWRKALGKLPIVRGGRWAVGGSASLALHGLPVDPRDLDLLVDHVAAAELVDGLRGTVVSDEARWDRGDMRAVRRALAVVHGVEVEILEGVEAVGPTGDVVVATPDLDHVDRIIVSGRRIPVLPLPTMQVLLDATGDRERAAMIAKVLGGADGTQGSWR